mgnify:CR=1 FL=1
MNYKSLGEIMWSITKNPLVSTITIEDAAESALRLLKTLKLPLSTVTDVVVKDIVDYKVKLPDTLIKVNAVRNYKGGANLIYSANPFHTAEREQSIKTYGCEPGTYVLQECNIVTSMADGQLEISYERLSVDEDGFPMIPDDASMENAIRYHVMFEHLEALWSVGKVTDKVFQHISQQRDWYVGQVSGSMKLANIDHAVTMANSINRLIVNNRLHEDNYRNMGNAERFKRHW